LLLMKFITAADTGAPGHACGTITIIMTAANTGITAMPGLLSTVTFTDRKITGMQGFVR
jgi:hypothetical protein